MLYSAQYIEILDQLTAITSKASECRNVAEVDACIENYRNVLGQMKDEGGSLLAIFEYRNSIIQLNNIKR